jgi:tetratricopeptide (TPR) repeat protein
MLDRLRSFLHRHTAASTPAHLRARYRHLEGEEVHEGANGARRFHRGWHLRREGLHVLVLRGDRYEMAFQHGRLLRELMVGGTLEQAQRVCRNSVRSALGDGPVARAVSFYAERVLTGVILHGGLARSGAAGKEPLLDGYGLSDGSGIALRTLIGAALAAEVAQVLLGQTDREPLPTCAAPDACCTSFAAWGSHTRGGELIIGRNTDYPLTGSYDLHPTVIYYQPDQGQRYMAVTSAGLHNAGVCGMNESGIYLAIHTVPTRHVSMSGLPAFMMGQELLREARSLDEVLEALGDQRPAAGWSYHVVSARERRAATVEMAADAIRVRRASAEHHVTTNHWIDPEMAPRYLTISATFAEDTEARYRRVEELILAAGGALDERGAMAALADKLDPIAGRIRSMPNTVASPTTVSSSVWLPDRGRLFVAAGAAPTSQGRFVELPTIDRIPAADAPPGWAEAPYQVIENDRHRRDHPALAEAEQLVIGAMSAFDARDDRGALQLLARATELEPDNPTLHLVRGLLAIRVQELGEARAAFEAALALPGDDHARRVARYARARVLARTGARDAALDELRSLLAVPGLDPRLADAASAALAVLAEGGKLKLGPDTIPPMIVPGDALHYRGLLSP